MSSQLQFEQWVPYPLERVFLFFANPGNLPRIMPPATGTRLQKLRLVPPPSRDTANVELFAGVGSEIVTSFRLFPFLPFRAQWISVVVEFEWDHHFADIQKRGPFKKFHHRHEFVERINGGVMGTTVRDVIEYDVGFGLLGQVANRVAVERRFRRIFAYRQATLVKLLG